MVKKLYGAYDLAEKLGVAHNTIYFWVSKGLPYTTEGVGIRPPKRFDIDEVKEWIEEYRNKEA